MFSETVRKIRSWQAGYEDLATLEALVSHHAGSPALMAEFKDVFRAQVAMLRIPPDRLRKYSLTLLHAAARVALLDNRISQEEQMFVERLSYMLNSFPGVKPFLTDTSLYAPVAVISRDEDLPVLYEVEEVYVRTGVRPLPGEVVHFVANVVQPFIVGDLVARGATWPVKWLTPCSVIVTSRRVLVVGKHRMAFAHGDMRYCDSYLSRQGDGAGYATIAWMTTSRMFYAYTSGVDARSLAIAISRLSGLY